MRPFLSSRWYSMSVVYQTVDGTERKKRASRDLISPQIGGTLQCVRVFQSGVKERSPPYGGSHNALAFSIASDVGGMASRMHLTACRRSI